jgi:hypothetical protein
MSHTLIEAIAQYLPRGILQRVESIPPNGRNIASTRHLEPDVTSTLASFAMAGLGTVAASLEPARSWDRGWIDGSYGDGLSVARKIEGFLVSPIFQHGWLNNDGQQAHSNSYGR